MVQCESVEEKFILGEGGNQLANIRETLVPKTLKEGRDEKKLDRVDREHLGEN